MLKYIVEPWFYFAWSNLIDGEHVPQALLRSEKPPGSYIWKASVYFQNANAAHLKGYKLQRTHNVNVLECSAGGLRPPLMSGSGSPWTLVPTHKHTSLKRKTGATERLFSHRNRVYPFRGIIYKGFNGGHLHKVCRRLRCSMCQMRAALRRAKGNNAKSPPPALLSPAPLGTLPCPPVRGSEEGGGGGGGGRPRKVNVPTLIFVKAHWVRINLHFRWKGWQYKKASCFWYVRAV